MTITINTKPYSYSGMDSDQKSVYFNRPAGAASGWSRLLAKVTTALTKGGTSKVEWKLKVPVIADAASACSCPGETLRESTVTISIVASNTATSAELLDIALRIKDLAASTEFQSSVSSLIQPTA